MKFKTALCQMAGSFKKEESMAKAKKMVGEAAEKGADVICLPEMWNCPYSNDYFREYSEGQAGRTVDFMSSLAKDNGIYLIGGSIPEIDDDMVYNTSFVFGRDGAMIGKHRKAHLFDIDVKDGIRFMESDTLTPGDSATVFDTEYGKIGLAICYDIRFPELSRKMALSGAKVIYLPGAFNMTTGPVHWGLSIRARALDNQVYFAACSPARDADGVYVAYGHSSVSDPWGKIIASAEEKEEIVFADIDTDYVDSVREQLPLLKHRRPELY